MPKLKSLPTTIIAMEFLLSPTHRGNPPISIPGTPYVAEERYDGGPWISYLSRKGKVNNTFNGSSFDFMEHVRAESVNPTPVKEKESLLQTWLYFGLIAEFVGINAGDNTRPAKHQGSEKLVEQIYDSLLVRDDGQTWVRLDADRLEGFLAMGKSHLPQDPDAREKRYNHLNACLTCTHQVLANLLKEFNHAIKSSIAALGELFTHSLGAELERLQVPRSFGRNWGRGFLNEEAKASMKEHGWCVSDITRAEAKYQSVQTLSIVRMLDKSLPARDHSRCTDSTCEAYQINTRQYEPQHQVRGCNCRQLVVNVTDLKSVLFKDDRFPLIRLKRDLHDLTYEIVESDVDTPYIAVSHVWADGLGNPEANSLHRCKLDHLRSLVDCVKKCDPEFSSNVEEAPLIWLDTLCCPAKDREGKQTAIEKIRLVYGRAKHVLVLDAGLMSYDSRTQDYTEQLVRIFTSSWMRRLWTLQEGALAKSLYFQFADKAISLNALGSLALQNKASIRHRTMMPDLIKEFLGLSSFFSPHAQKPPGDPLALHRLDNALQCRSVSVATDEPLCIGTLLSLDFHAILQVKPEGNRMQKVWELIAAKKGGIQSQIIFFEGPKVQAEGWRWAPQSLLAGHGVQTPGGRAVRWADPHLGLPTPKGLRVMYAGYRIMARKDYGDGRPRNPWPGMPRLSVDWVQFRDVENGYWYRISDKHPAWITDEGRREQVQLGQFPLHDIANMDRPVLIMNSRTELRDSLFATVADDGVEGQEMDGIPVRTQRNVLVHNIAEQGYIYDVLEKLAHYVRNDEITDRHLVTFNQILEEHRGSDEDVMVLMNQSDAFKSSIEQLKQKMQGAVMEAITTDEKFAATVTRYWGQLFLEHMWVLLRDWFYHDFKGERLGDEQVWFVD